MVALMLGSGAARAETLAEAMALAYGNNPTLLGERASLRATDEEVPQALGGWRPTVVFETGAGIKHIDSESNAGLGAKETLNPYDFALVIEQSLYSGGRTVADVKRAENTVMAERATLTQVEQEILLTTTQVFVDVLRDHAVLKLAINNEQRLRRQLDAARDRFEVGEVTRTDVAQAEARVSKAVAERIQAESDLITARASYLNVVGHLPETLTPARVLTGTPQSEREARDIAMNEHPTVLAAMFAERAALQDVEIASGVLLPELTLQGSYSQVHDSSTFIDTQDTATLRAELSIPLYQTGAEYSAVRAAKQIASRSRIEIEIARRVVIENVTRAWEVLQAARAQITALRSAVRAADIALEGVTQEAAVGSRTTLDVLDAEQELFDSQVDLVRAERDEIIASYALAATTGRLTATRLGLRVQIYDVRRNYDAVRDKLWGTSIE